ncbi:aldehyde dehydrogenase family protein [Streptomyces cavernicola]|uniref:aldehyde dehydrogenase (NAD(+)) n=1 Tax=Streptomyces cavernicola TaxID=3043613 RepID=A0ABT6SE24_9ACTN|nr:aldehyde dehydrogenase family protein [Streptomyces sp. B-S-A6]MDI3406214.1 aldehyde dehydrogenase family protein [Streptomyces sp. B-S-A6]
MNHRSKIYVDGAWTPSTGSETTQVVNAATEQVMGSTPAGTAEDVDRAVTAARRAFADWSQTPAEQRAKLLDRAVEALLDRQTELATLISQEVGMPYLHSNLIQVGLPVMSFATAAELARSYAFTEQQHNSLVVREPIGVVGAITPWNYPLHQIAAKIAPALATGCTVVLKPSEVAPLNAFVLADILHEVGLPDGVFNLVSGKGTVVGEAIAAHPEVDMVSFTGSTRAGRRVAELAAATVKRVALELGGKSPLIVLDDADLTAAVTRGVTACFLNTGQTCSALTRLIVPRARLAEAEQIAKTVAEAIPVGDPFQPGTVLGPVISDRQRETVRDYIRRGIEEGARLVTGGTEPPQSLDTGYYVQPTVFSDTTRDMAIVQEEIFGPVLVIQAYDDEDDAIRIANDTPYGLNAGVFSADLDRAQHVARRIRSGQVEINGAPWNHHAPFGGYKQSGTGRELGTHGLEEFLETKAIQLP